MGYEGQGQEQQQQGEGQMVSIDTWYMSKTENSEANVAYSLYGILAGEEDNGCTSGTFINSFFTSAGLESYLSAFAETGVFGNTQVNNQCLIFDENNQNADGWNGMYGSYNFNQPNEYGYYGSNGYGGGSAGATITYCHFAY